MHMFKVFRKAAYLERIAKFPNPVDIIVAGEFENIHVSGIHQVFQNSRSSVSKRLRNVSGCILYFLFFSSVVFAKPPAKPPVKPSAKPPAQPQVVSKKPPSTNLEATIKGQPGQSNEPMFIRSDNFQLDSKNRLFHYRDNVQVIKGDLTITSDIMTGKYDANNQLQEMVAENNVVITRGDRLRATSNRAFYDIAKDKITLTEGPELNDRGNVLTADKVILLVKEDRSEAEGHVRVKVTKSDEQGDLLKQMKGGGRKEGEDNGAAPAVTPSANEAKQADTDTREEK